MTSCTFLGDQPDSIKQKNFTSSEAFNSTTGRFENPPDQKITNKISYTEMFKEYFKSDSQRVPTEKLPEQVFDEEHFLKASSQVKMMWMGHSSFLLRLHGKTILVDPVLSGSASPVSFLVKRFQAPVLSVDTLPKIDLILISHDHYDHLDYDTVKHFADSSVPFMTPLGVGSHLQKWGIKPEQISELAWWDDIDFHGIKLTCTPARHFSGRGVTDKNKTLWASWAIKAEHSNIYYSGDSGYGHHYKKIGETLGPFDLAILENGQYDERWPDVHQTPEETAQASVDLKAKHIIPVHWGMFELAFHPWKEPAERLLKQAKLRNLSVLTPVLGQILDLSHPHKYTNRWWRKENESTSKVVNISSAHLNGKEKAGRSISSDTDTAGNE